MAARCFDLQYSNKIIDEEMRSFVLDASQALDPKLEVQPPPVIGFSEIPFPFKSV